MLTYGIAKENTTRDDGTLWIKVRIPSIHGADSQSAYGGQTIRNYVYDKDLPWFQSILMSDIPNSGDTVVLSSINESNNRFIVLGIMKRS